MKKSNKIQKYALLTVLFFVFLISLPSVSSAALIAYYFDNTTQGTITVGNLGDAGINATITNIQMELIPTNKITSLVFTWNGVDAAANAFTFAATIGSNNYSGSGTYAVLVHAPGVTVENMTFTSGYPLVSGQATFLFNTAGVIKTGGVLVNAVPVPAAVWLLGTGLVGLVGLRKRFNK